MIEAKIFQENKTAVLIIAIVLFLIELEILAVFVMKSGSKSTLQFLDNRGNVVFETDGKDLSDFNKYYFEKTFGPVKDYTPRQIRKEVPFPFRAWFTSAIGFPVGIVLLYAFVFKAFFALFVTEKAGDKQAEKALEGSEKKESKENRSGRLTRIFNQMRSFNIFFIGVLVFLGILAFWVVPETILFVGRVGEETIMRYKWFFIAAIAAGLGILLWMIYLRYLLAKKTIDTQTDLEKHRLELEYRYQGPKTMYLADNTPDDKPMLSHTQSSGRENTDGEPSP